MAADSSRPTPRVVSPGSVVTMLYGFPSTYAAVRDYGEIAPAIARASSDAPLFPDNLAGSEATACLLVAWAWEATRFMKGSAPSSSLGIYALRPPPYVDGARAMIAIEASLVAIDRMRDAMRFSQGRAWHERLAPFVAECWGEKGPTPRVLEASRRVAALAESLLVQHYMGSRGSGERKLSRLLSPSQDSATSAR